MSEIGYSCTPGHSIVFAMVFILSPLKRVDDELFAFEFVSFLTSMPVVSRMPERHQILSTLKISLHK